MDNKTAGLGIVLVLALHSAFAQEAIDANPPPPPPEPTAEQRDAGRQYQQAQLDLYDALRGDSSPRTQVLAARIYVDEDDAANALRPKRAEVVARAAQLAPDDAFVQWIAAAEGNYYSSQCGPTQWPEAEVGNLVRLEPDNAGALLYTVALAQAKGDQSALDETLARMASASRAEDHSSDEVAQWRRIYAARPDGYGFVGSPWSGATEHERALLAALQRLSFGSSSVDPTLQNACKASGEIERAWQRLDACISAGTLLAAKGNSFALRETGLRMLAAAGATPSDVVHLQRQLDWLKANAANPLRNGSAFRDTPADLVADWRDAPGEIAATERRLTRLGEPVTAPAGWVATDASDYADYAESDTDKVAKKAWLAYVRLVLDDLVGSSDVRERAAGLSMNTFAAEWLDEDARLAAPNTYDSTKANPDTALADLAAAHPDDMSVQWIAATAHGGDEAIARVQRLEPDNAAVWTLALGSPEDSAAALHGAAAAKHFDDHSVIPVALLYTAFRRHPAPAEVQAQWQETLGEDVARARDPEKIAAFGAAISMAMANMPVTPFAKLPQICRPGHMEMETTTKADCMATARLMLNSRTSLLSALFGAATLSKFEPLQAAERDRARQIAWWQQGMSLSRDYERYIDDYLATGSEIEALRLMATRAGNAEPPADWQSPAEKRASKGQ